MRGRRWPTVALECGYSELYEDLRQDATLLLVGSEGRIGRVILVKLDRIGESGAVENGFVEVWQYDSESGAATKRGDRYVRLSLVVRLSLLTFAKKIFPPPQSRQTQALRFTAGEVLRGMFDEATADLESRDQILPHLGLEMLREIVTANAERHVAQATEDDDDEHERDD